MLNKRGQGLQINTIILTILGIAILVFLIWGFLVGWDKFLPWLSPGSNVDDMVSQCMVACSTNSVYGFCTQQRTLKAPDLPKDANEKDQKQVSNTCSYFSTDSAYIKYNIVACSNLCPAV
jgi:hypothetical protein